MGKKNLFIVGTPFHLLTAFILSTGKFQADQNYLALLHPHGYEKWQNSKVMTYLSSTDCGYQSVFPLITWMTKKNKTQSYRQQVNEVKNTIGKIGIDDIFLGSDIDVQNQLLVGALGKDKFYRYEDGLYSYYNENRRRPLSHMLFHKLKIKLIEKISGIHTNVAINTSTASDSKSGIGDFMYKPELLQRYSPKAYEITNEMIAEAVGILNNQGLLEAKMQENSILYLSQPLVEQKRFTMEEELAILKEIVNNLVDKCQLLYKPHPNDSADKIRHYQKEIPQMKIFNSIDPVELSFAYEENLQAVISYQSTALMFPDKFTDRKIKSISLVSFYKEPLYPAYVQIMQGAGVKFPTSIDEVIQFLK